MPSGRCPHRVAGAGHGLASCLIAPWSGNRVVDHPPAGLRFHWRGKHRHPKHRYRPGRRRGYPLGRDRDRRAQQPGRQCLPRPRRRAGGPGLAGAAGERLCRLAASVEPAGAPLLGRPDPPRRPAEDVDPSARAGFSARAVHLVVRSLLSIPDSSVNRPNHAKAGGARRNCGSGNGLHESHS